MHMNAKRVTTASTATGEKVEHETRVTEEEGKRAGEAPAPAEADAEEEEARAEDEAERAGACHEGDGDDVGNMDAKALGRRGEDAAARYLEQQGYEILERNWTCRYGEADVVAKDPGGALCFVEVKTRRSVEAGIPEEAVTPEKQRRYEKIALCYLIENEFGDGAPVRFDAIGICVTDNHRALLRHHKGCFDGLF